MNLWVLLATHLQHVRNARRSPEGIKAQQLRKFRRLIAYAQRKSPYYRELISSRGIDINSCVPEDFPVLTKSILMENFNDIVTDRRITREGIAEFLEASKNPSDLFRGRYTVVHTSGTSGEVGYFVYSSTDWARGVSHALRINPVRPGKRRMAFYGATEGHFTGVTFAASAQRSILKLKYSVATYDINRPIAEVIDGLNAFQPDILMGYASSLAILAQRQARGELNISPRWIESSGEVITSADWELIESTFGVPLFNVYASTEHLLMGMGSRRFGGTYLFEDELIFELAPNHTLITNLFNYTLPLVRYRMDDILERQEDSQKIYPFTKIRNIEGRSEYVPHFINSRGEEDFISPHIINEFFVRNVRRFQLEVVDKTNCIFRVCLVSGLSDHERADTVREVEARLGEIFEQKDMANVSRRVEVVDDLLPDHRTGKFRLILV
jgi:phenylacetate-CoA ligase